MNAPAAPQLSPELVRFFGKIQPGAPVPLPSMSVVPLLLADEGPDAELLEEGIEAGHTSVSEVSDSGDVNSINVLHQGQRLLLLVDGEEITGAKQNRVVNASFLVPPGEPVVIPVSCVERGRWRYESRGFRSSGRTLSSSARGSKLSRVTRSVTSNGNYDADQGAVWRDVDQYLNATQTASSTAAFSDAAEQRQRAMEQWLEMLTPSGGQVGMAVVNGSSLVSLDLFGSSQLYRRAWKKIARGVLVEIYDRQPGNGDPRAVVTRALASVSRSAVIRKAAPGCGETLHGSSEGLVVGAVAHQGAVYHAMVAPA